MTALVGRDELLDALACLRDDPDLSFGFLSSLTATDWPGKDPRYWVVVRAALDGAAAPRSA